MKQRVLRWFALLCLAVIAAGFIPWNVTAPARWAGRKIIAQKPGWDFTLERARLLPGGKLELRDLQVQPPGGVRLRFSQLNLRPRSVVFSGGRWISRWEFDEVRMDFSSLGFEGAATMAILPVGSGGQGFGFRGSAVLEVERDNWKLSQLALEGANMNLHFGENPPPG